MTFLTMFFSLSVTIFLFTVYFTGIDFKNARRLQDESDLVLKKMLLNVSAYPDSSLEQLEALDVNFHEMADEHKELLSLWGESLKAGNRKAAFAYVWLAISVTLGIAIWA
jgi:hypothetical protein